MQDRAKTVLQNVGTGAAAGGALGATAGYIFHGDNLCDMIVPPLFSKPITYTPVVVNAITQAVSHEYQTLTKSADWLDGFYRNDIVVRATQGALNSMANFALNMSPALIKDSALQVCGEYMSAGSFIPKVLWWGAIIGAAAGLYYSYENWNTPSTVEPEEKPKDKFDPILYAAPLEYNTIQPVAEDVVKPAEPNQIISSPPVIAEVHIDVKPSATPVTTPTSSTPSPTETAAAKKAKLLFFHNEFGQTQKSLSPKRKEEEQLPELQALTI